MVDTEAPAAAAGGHVVLCGLNELGHRTPEELFGRARSVVVVTSSDIVNLETALNVVLPQPLGPGRPGLRGRRRPGSCCSASAEGAGGEGRMHRWARADRRDPPTAAGRTLPLRACRMAADGSLELVRTTTYRYTTWSPYASPFTATARSSEVVSQAAVRPVGPLAAGQPLVQPVALAVPPEGPGSVKTELVEIGWAVHARPRVDISRETEMTRPITVLSQARDCAAVAHRPPVVEDHGGAVLGFETLSSRRLVPGVPLSGVLTVAPLRSVSARGVRVDLVLLEHVLHGPRLTDDPTRNPAAQDKYVVDRQLRRDPCVGVELHAVTTPQ